MKSLLRFIFLNLMGWKCLICSYEGDEVMWRNQILFFGIQYWVGDLGFVLMLVWDGVFLEWFILGESIILWQIEVLE